MTFSVSTPSSSPKLVQKASSERPAPYYDLTVAMVSIVRINVIHPQNGLKWVVISAEQDPGNLVANMRVGIQIICRTVSTNWGRDSVQHLS
jgi:hypothetical protein